MAGARTQRLVMTIVGIVLVAVYTWAQQGAVESTPGSADAIVEAFQNRTSNVQVSGVGVVRRILPDDNAGSRHQRFILELSGGHTILVSHNIDLANRLTSLDRGDTVAFFFANTTGTPRAA